MPNVDRKFLGLCLVGIILAVWFGFILGRQNYQDSIGTGDFGSIDQNVNLYDLKTATVTGKILEVNGRTVRIENERGDMGLIEVSDPFAIIKNDKGQVEKKIRRVVNLFHKRQVEKAQ